MTLPRRIPDRCPECFRAVSGYSSLICVECGAVNPTAGYAGLARKRRTRPERPKKKRPRYGAATGRLTASAD